MRRVIGIGNIAQRILVSLHALDQHIVVFASGVISAARLGLADNRFSEIVECARVGAGAEERNLLVWPFRSHLVPMRDFSLRTRLPYLFQIGDCEGSDPCILVVDDYGERVEGHRQFDKLDAVSFRLGHFFGEYRTRCVCYINFAAHEFLEAAAGAGNSDRDLRLAFALELLSYRLGDRKDGA